MSHRLSIIAIFLSVFLGLTLSSCHSSRTVTTASSHGYTKKGEVKKSSGTVAPPSLKGMDSASAALIKEAESWLGTPYKYGGNDRGGVDCSGFVLQVYLRALDIKLPRTSREQNEFCQKVDKSRLTPGDLLFFKTTKGSDRISHVGIYAGENKMIHSSTSQGVIFTDLATDYYVRTYAGAGKVGQYHSMLSRGKKGNEEKEVKKKDAKKSEALPREIPTEVSLDDLDRVMTASSKASTTSASSAEAATSPAPTTEKSGGYTTTVVTSLPAKTTTASSKPQGPVTPTVRTVASPGSATSAAPEPSVEDARNSVLNSIVEKDL